MYIFYIYIYMCVCGVLYLCLSFFLSYVRMTDTEYKNSLYSDRHLGCSENFTTTYTIFAFCVHLLGLSAKFRRPSAKWKCRAPFPKNMKNYTMITDCSDNKTKCWAPISTEHNVSPRVVHPWCWPCYWESYTKHFIVLI